MKLKQQKLMTSLFEEQFQNYLKLHKQKFQFVQKILLFPLLIFYTITKAFDYNWIDFSINLLLFLFIVFSLKYERKSVKIYNIILTFGILAFNLFYAFSTYYNYSINRYTFIDGYFLAILTLAILNMFDKIIPIIILIIIYVFYIILISNPNEPLWQQIIKFISYCLIYIHQHNYQNELLKHIYLQYNKHQTIENFIRRNQEIKCFVIHFNDSKQKLELENSQSLTFMAEETEKNFFEFARTLIIRENLEVNFQSKINQKQEKLNLEQYLYYLFTNKKNRYFVKKTNEFNQENSYCNLFGMNKEESFNINIVQCFDIRPCIIMLITENYKEQTNKKLKLQKQFTDQIYTYFSDIFQKHIRLSLVLQKQILNHLKCGNVVKQYIKGSFYRLLIGQNSFYNMQEFLLINNGNDNIVTNKFDLLKLIQESAQCVSIALSWKGCYNIQAIYEEFFITQDFKKLKMLFINLSQFCFKISNSIEIAIEELIGEDAQQKKLIKICITLFSHQNKSLNLNKLVIVNPQTLEEFKHNCKQQFNLEMPIALFIIRRLGPFNKIYLTSIDQTTFRLEFYLYKNIKSDLKLIPLVSINPRECITKKKSSNCFPQQKRGTLLLFNQLPEFHLDTQRNATSSPFFPK